MFKKLFYAVNHYQSLRPFYTELLLINALLSFKFMLTAAEISYQKLRGIHLQIPQAL